MFYYFLSFLCAFHHTKVVSLWPLFNVYCNKSKVLSLSRAVVCSSQELLEYLDCAHGFVYCPCFSLLPESESFMTKPLRLCMITFIGTPRFHIEKASPATKHTRFTRHLMFLRAIELAYTNRSLCNEMLAKTRKTKQKCWASVVGPCASHQVVHKRSVLQQLHERLASI